MDREREKLSDCDKATTLIESVIKQQKLNWKLSKIEIAKTRLFDWINVSIRGLSVALNFKKFVIQKVSFLSQEKSRCCKLL